MTLVQRQGRLIQRSQAFKTPIGPTSNRSDNRDYKNSPRSNKPGPSEALTGPFEAPTGPPQAPLAQDPGVNCYNQQDLDRII